MYLKQGADFDRELAPGKYKVEVKARRQETGPMLEARSALDIRSSEAAGQVRQAAR